MRVVEITFEHHEEREETNVVEGTIQELPRKRGTQGFGSPNFSKERQREIASIGGKTAHRLGTAHKWTSEEAQAAGRKGGERSRRGSGRSRGPSTQAATVGDAASASVEME